MLEINLRKKHHKVLAGLVVVFAIAWAVWTFFLLPASQTPSLPAPVAPGGNAVPR